MGQMRHLSGPAGRAYDVLPLQGPHQRRLRLTAHVAVPKLALVILAPGVHLPVLCHRQAVGRAQRQTGHLLARESLQLARVADVFFCAVTQFEVVSISPGRAHGWI